MPPKTTVTGYTYLGRHVAAGFYYYFKTILAMYTTEGLDTPVLTLSPAIKAVAGALALVILVLGVYPKPLQQVLTSDRAVVVAK